MLARLRCASCAPALVFAAACADPAPAPPPATVVSAAIAGSPRSAIFRDLVVTLSEPSPVQVEYWAAGAPRLRVISPAAATQHTIFLPRLRARAGYTYEVRAIGEDSVRGDSLRGQFVTDSLPSDLAGVRFSARGTPTTPLVMLELRFPFYAVIVDQDGEVVWYWQTGLGPQGSTRRANGNWVFLDPNNHTLREVTPDGRPGAGLDGTAQIQMHHDVVATPQNTLYFLSLDTATFSGTVWTGEAIYEWNPETGSVVRRWRSADMMNPALDSAPRTTTADWLHANALNIGPRGNVLVSLHSLNQIISLTPDFSAFEWRLGGPRSTRAVAGTAVFTGQHAAAELDGNHVLMFDNGYERTTTMDSRALEIDLGTGSTAPSIAWEWEPQPGNWARIISSARRLTNGNTLVLFGSAGLVGSTGPLEVFEVTRSGSAIWDLLITNPGSSIFRATPVGSIAGETVIPTAVTGRLAAR